MGHRQYGLEAGMIVMPIIMVAPFLALFLFYFPFLTSAPPGYPVLLLVAAFCHFIMFNSMRAKAKTGLKAMIGEEALVVEDAEPEGKVEIRGKYGKRLLVAKRSPPRRQ